MNDHEQDKREADAKAEPAASVYVEAPSTAGTDAEKPLDGERPEGRERLFASLDAANEAEGEEPKKKSMGREILEWVLVIVVAVAAALLIRTFIFEPVRVDGESMLNTLHDNEYMIVTKYQYIFGDPQRFDVVICHYPNRGNTNFVKRIVGIPGDTISMYNGILYVNGEAVDEPYIDNKATTITEEILVEEGHYFVMGDNRNNSNDSRAPAVGQLERSQIVGKVRLVAWPISAWRVVR